MVGGKIQATAHPRGLSGGAVFSWPKTACESTSGGGPRRLVGVAHTYVDPPGCMVGTRIDGVIAAIFHQYPDLEHRVYREWEESIPVAVVWYLECDWPTIKKNFADGGNLPETFNKWREAAQTGIETLRRRGVEAIPVPLGVEEVARYCLETRQPNNGRTRGQLASKCLADSIRGQPPA